MKNLQDQADWVRILISAVLVTVIFLIGQLIFQHPFRFNILWTLIAFVAGIIINAIMLKMTRED